MTPGRAIPAVNCLYSRYIHRLYRYHGAVSQQLEFCGVSDAATTLHFPFTHPHLPAPQSIGPSQTFVHSRVQTPLFALLIQLVGWQHSAGTQSSSVMQSCNAGREVVISVVGCEGVGEGDTLPDGVLEMHPLTRTRPAVKKSRITSKPGGFMTMLPCIVMEHDSFYGQEEQRRHSQYYPVQDIPVQLISFRE